MKANRLLIIIGTGLIVLGGCARIVSGKTPAPAPEPIESGKVAVYVKGDYDQWDLRFHLPEWAQAAKSPEDADWIIDYRLSTKERKIIDYKSRGINKNIRPMRSFLYTFLISTTLTATLTAIILSEREVWDPEVLAFISLPIGSLSGLWSWCKAVISKYSKLSGSIANTFTGSQKSFSCRIYKVTPTIEDLLREMIDDRGVPELVANNLSDTEQEIIQSPFLNIELEARDDVELYEIEYKTSNYHDLVSLAGQMEYRVVKPIPLDVGENTMTITLTDLYGRSTSKEYHLFRTRGASVETAEEFIITKTLDWSAPQI